MCRLKHFGLVLLSLLWLVFLPQPLSANSYTQETELIRLMELKSQLQLLKKEQSLLRPIATSLKTNSKLLVVAMKNSKDTPLNSNSKSESLESVTEISVATSKQPVEILQEVSSQLQTFKSTLKLQLTDLQTNYSMSQEDLRKATESTNLQLEYIAEMEQTISDLKAALSSNREDTGVALTLAGDLFEQVTLLENDVAKLKYHTSELENNIAIMEKQLKNSYVVGTVMSSGFSIGIGGYMIYKGVKEGNTPLYISGAIVAITPTLVYQGGHWIMKWW